MLVNGKEVSYDGVIYKVDYGHFPQAEQNIGYRQNYLVPEGTRYVIGDNVSNSYDSRFFRPVEEEEIIGRW